MGLSEEVTVQTLMSSDSGYIDIALIDADTRSSRSDDNKPEQCVVCLDSISERAEIVPCGHQDFDFICLVSWLEQHPTCPLCKKQAQTVEYGKKSSGRVNIYTVPQPANSTTLPVPVPQTNLRRSQLSPLTHHLIDTKASLSRRRYIYCHNLYSLHIGSNPHSRFTELNPQAFLTNPSLVSRARKWIRRELQVFDHLNETSRSTSRRNNDNEATGSQPNQISKRARNAEFLLEYIIGILKSVDLKGSGGQAEDMIQEFLGRDNTRLFLHELRAWLRSPYTDLQDWDLRVQYASPAEPSRRNEELSYDASVERRWPVESSSEARRKRRRINGQGPAEAEL